MLRHPSAKKRARQALKRQERAKMHKGKMRAAIKHVLNLLKEGKIDEARIESRRAESAIAKVVSKGIIHWKKGARITSRLMAKINKAALAQKTVEKTSTSQSANQ